jgi:hypothetical protein
MDRPLPSEAKPLRAMRPCLSGCLLIAIGAIAVLVDSDGLQALQRAAGYTVGSQNVFGEVFQYLTGLRDGLAPLAIPAAGIGLAGAGFAYMAGSPLAQRVGMGVVLGTALVLLGPTIVQ